MNRKSCFIIRICWIEPSCFSIRSSLLMCWNYTSRSYASLECYDYQMLLSFNLVTKLGWFHWPRWSNVFRSSNLEKLECVQDTFLPLTFTEGRAMVGGDIYFLGWRWLLTSNLKSWLQHWINIQDEFLIDVYKEHLLHDKWLLPRNLFAE